MNNPFPNLGRPMPADAAQALEIQPSPAPAQPQANPEMALNALPSAKAMELLLQDPIGFIQKIVDEAADHHLTDLKEQAELNGALSAFRKIHPEFQRFEPFIVQEAGELLKHDDTLANEDWPQILEKAMENFKQKFSQTVQENQLSAQTPAPRPPYVEGSSNRIAPENPANFTREQIGKMSMQDFLKNESAINDALRNNRIR
jgi:hypothetical protein